MVFRAGFREALDDFGKDARLELGSAEVIEEEQRLGAEHGDVVHAMIDQILADGVVSVQCEGDFELGANSIDAGDEHRLFVPLCVEREEAAEPADFAQHFTAMRGREQLRKCGFDAVAEQVILGRHPVGGLAAPGVGGDVVALRAQERRDGFGLRDGQGVDDAGAVEVTQMVRQPGEAMRIRRQ